MILLICGAGQYGCVAREIAEAMGVFSSIIFLDDNSKLAVGKLNEINEVNYDMACVAIGNSEIRRRLLEQIKTPATLIHPKAIIMPSAEVGIGSIIEAGAVISSNARIGKGTIVMANATVGHNSKIGDYCQLKYNCSISDGCEVKSFTKVECNLSYGKK